ncbi:MAG: CehA/McbA family metallohydrolase [Planctomycetota bacterium]|nr:CehA/McbA family metallohydrolase [Planctomycetota bacterium]
MNRLVYCIFFQIAISLVLLSATATVTTAEFELRVVDATTKQLISVRMSIQNARGATIKQRGVPFHAGHFCFFGKHVFKLPRGVYTYKIEHGPEYQTVAGQFEIKRGANDGITVEIPRFINLSEDGWWSGDLEIHRPEPDIPVVMDANGLNFSNLIAVDNEAIKFKNGFPKTVAKKINEKIAYYQTGMIDSRHGGGLVVVGMNRQIELPDSKSLLPFNLASIDSDNPFVFANNASNWDLPLLLANSKLHRFNLDGIAIAGESIRETSAQPNRIDLRPPTPAIVGEHKLEKWQTTIYYHALNCGFKIPPVACSASGKSRNPVGYNRVYVHTGRQFTAEKWIENLKLGRVIVTNGPVMKVLFNGVLPGETFQVPTGKSIEIETALTLSLKEKADYLEIIRNGLVAKKISLDDYAKARGRLPKITFQESGWMLVRVVTNNKKAYHFASSAPIYIQIGNQPVLKKLSAQFFLDWILERATQIQKSSSADKDEIIETMRPAFEFWKHLVKQAG